MSLTAVREEHVVRANEVTREEFVEMMASSLPLGLPIIMGLIREVAAGSVVAEFNPPTLDNPTRNELLRIMASTSMRTSLERHYGVDLGFVNCHKVVASAQTPEGQAERDKKLSVAEQVRSQSPNRRDC